MNFNPTGIPAEVEKLITRTEYVGYYPPPVTEMSARLADTESDHVAIAQKGASEITMLPDFRSMEWQNNGAIYKNTTEDSYLFIHISVSPLVVQGSTTLCFAQLYIGDGSPSILASWACFTNVLSQFSTVLTRGNLSAWIKPGWFYSLNGLYGGKIDKCVRYWLPDPGTAPPLQ